MEHRVELIWANRSQLQTGQVMQQHYHACHQLYYILSGSSVFLIGNRSVQAAPGKCFLVPAGTPHQMLPVQDGPLDCLELKIFIKDPFLLERLQQPPEPVKDDGAIKRLLSYAAENWNSRDPQNQLDIEYVLSAVLLNFFVDTLRYAHEESTHILTENYSTLTKSILVYIEKHFSRHFSLQELGQELNYNKNYLCSVFIKDTGVTIVEYLNFVRIRRAMIFFAFYGQDVNTACESVGYGNLSHFSRTFKAMVGMPPRDFRKAFSLLTQEEAAKLFTDERFLSYQPCTMAEAFTSLQHSGQVAMQILKKHPQD